MEHIAINVNVNVNVTQYGKPLQAYLAHVSRCPSLVSGAWATVSNICSRRRRNYSMS
jgi:hypothetical protein